MISLGINNIRWWNLLVAIIERNLLSRYKLSKLGFYWMFLGPVLHMLIIGFVFQFFVPININNYFVFLYIGILAWNYYSTTVMRNTTIIINEKALIQKSNFPREVVVLSVVFTNFINFAISLVFLLIFLTVTLDGNFITWLWLPVPILLLVLLILGMSFWLSTLYVKNRDLEFVISSVLPLWFYGTPIIYNLEIFPKSIAWLFYLNPMTFIVEVFRYVLIGTPIQLWWGCIAGIVMVFGLFVSGVLLFRREAADFNDWI